MVSDDLKRSQRGRPAIKKESPAREVAIFFFLLVKGSVDQPNPAWIEEGKVWAEVVKALWQADIRVFANGWGPSPA